MNLRREPAIGDRQLKRLRCRRAERLAASKDQVSFPGEGPHREDL